MGKVELSRVYCITVVIKCLKTTHESQLTINDGQLITVMH